MDDFFKIKNSLMPEKGKVLISEPLMKDFYFSQAIILLAEYNEEGTIGFVINHPVKLKMQDLFPDFPAFKSRISLGGPVSTNSIQYIYRNLEPLPGSLTILPGLHWGGDFELLKENIALGTLVPKDILFFLGYSGWAPDQLEEEIAENNWVVADLSVAELLSAGRKSYSQTLEKLGSKYKAWANFPIIPEMN
jgi:putative transcriptional regulator